MGSGHVNRHDAFDCGLTVSAFYSGMGGMKKGTA
jgi:hypothetical protein